MKVYLKNDMLYGDGTTWTFVVIGETQKLTTWTFYLTL